MSYSILIGILSGIGAGLGTGFAGMSAAVVITPMLVAFLNIPAYEAVGIALASDVLASAFSAYTYYRNKNIDIKNGVYMMAAVLTFTLVGSVVSNLGQGQLVGNFSIYVTLYLGVRFLIKPVNKVKQSLETMEKSARIRKSLIWGSLIGFVCGFVGAGGGMLMLFILTRILGYDLKKAVGTSLFIMAATAFTGAVSHFVIDGMPNLVVLFSCIISTMIFAQLGALFANKAKPEILGRVMGALLIVLVAVIYFVERI